MIQTLNELESLIAAAVRPARISIVSEPEPAPAGLTVRIDHGDSEYQDDGMRFSAETFPVYAFFSIEAAKWADALKSARAVKQAIIVQKTNWRPGPISREDGSGVYSVRLTVFVTKTFRP